MTDMEIRLRCLEYAMEIYRKQNVGHLRVDNVADELYCFVAYGRSQMNPGDEPPRTEVGT